MKIKPLRNGKITLSFIDIGKCCLNREFFTLLMCPLMLFAKILVKISKSTVNDFWSLSSQLEMQNSTVLGRILGTLNTLIITFEWKLKVSELQLYAFS